MPEQIIPILSKPGIKRDGTPLDGDNYIDGQWCRFRRGKPRKIGGYRAINKYLPDVVRTLSEYTRNDRTYVHCGSAEAVQQLFIDGSFNTSVIKDRTPAGLTASDDNLWQFAIASRLQGGIWTPKLLAQVAPNLTNITNSDGGQLFVGDLLDDADLTAVTEPTGFDCSGGVTSLHPYVFAFGSAGYVAWSIAGNPEDWTGTGSGAANVASQKVIRGMAMRGGAAQSPSGIFWTANAVVRAGFVGGTSVFKFDTLTEESSILGAQTPIEYDGVFYWPGVDRFLMFNGVVKEVPNDMNADFFFDNLNFDQRQKVFSFKVPRYGEIWWCFPKGASSEPNHAVIYNVRENSWYDTPLPNSGRGAGIFPSVFKYPLLTGVDPNLEDEEAHYRLWVHETGVDEIDGQSIQPVRSYFETADFSLPVQSQVNKATQILRIEPDFVQAGDMTVQVRGQNNARAPVVAGEQMPFPAEATTVDEQTVKLKTQRRQLRLRFESNTIGGDYQTGLVLGHVQPGDGRTTT